MSENYPQFVDRLFASPDFIRQNFDSLEDWEIDFIHAVVGMSTEVGELMDQVKRRLFYGVAMDTDNLNEETGDAGFYGQKAVNVLVDRLKQRHPQDCNREKLEIRYHKGSFSTDQATARADKEEGGTGVESRPERLLEYESGESDPKNGGNGEVATITFTETEDGESISMAWESNRHMDAEMEMTMVEQFSLWALGVIGKANSGALVPRADEGSPILMPPGGVVGPH